MRQVICLVLIVLCGCVPVVSRFYQPVGTGDIRLVSGGCSMSPLLQITQHLAANLDVEVSAIAKTSGTPRASITMSIRVPDSTTVRLTEPTITLQEAPSGPAIKLRIDSIHRPRTTTTGPTSKDFAPNDLLYGPAAYGISMDLPQDNPAELIITLPPLDIKGQHIQVAPMKFVLKTRPHMTGFC